MVIFIDCPRDIRYKRVLSRDNYIGDIKARLSKYGRRYWVGEPHYLAIEKPIDLADLIYK